MYMSESPVHWNKISAFYITISVLLNIAIYNNGVNDKSIDSWWSKINYILTYIVTKAPLSCTCFVHVLHYSTIYNEQIFFPVYYIQFVVVPSSSI